MASEIQQQDGGLRTSRPPEDFRPVREWTLHEFTELATVRSELLLEITAAGAGPQVSLRGVPETMILVASELATNALKHGLPPTIVRLSTDGRDYLLDVADHDLTTEPKIDGQRAMGAGGLGLQIARRMAQDVGWYATETTKHVWVVFAAQA